jgi:hypothetical protein
MPHDLFQASLAGRGRAVLNLCVRSAERLTAPTAKLQRRERPGRRVDATLKQALSAAGRYCGMRTIFLLSALLVLAGCGEEPQRLEAAQTPGANSDNWNEQLRERTLNQGEAERIYR